MCKKTNHKDLMACKNSQILFNTRLKDEPTGLFLRLVLIFEFLR